MSETKVMYAGPAAGAPQPTSAQSPAPVPAPNGPAPQTPSQAVVADANEVVYVQDVRGRTLGYRLLNWVDRSRFLQILGADAENNAYRSEVLPAMLCVEIDGRKMGRPPSRGELIGRMAVLGDEGQAAILQELGRRMTRRVRQDLFDTLKDLADRYAATGAEEEMAAALQEVATHFLPDDEIADERQEVKN